MIIGIERHLTREEGEGERKKREIETKRSELKEGGRREEEG